MHDVVFILKRLSLYPVFISWVISEKFYALKLLMIDRVVSLLLWYSLK